MSVERAIAHLRIPFDVLVWNTEALGVEDGDIQIATLTRDDMSAK
jgi:hypothetical protein